jgi:hypothetical protein
MSSQRCSVEMQENGPGGQGNVSRGPRRAERAVQHSQWSEGFTAVGNNLGGGMSQAVLRRLTRLVTPLFGHRVPAEFFQSLVRPTWTYMVGASCGLDIANRGLSLVRARSGSRPPWDIVSNEKRRVVSEAQ